jgi:hypothetical protein
MNAQESRWRITPIWHGIRKRQNHLLGSKRADWEESPITQLRRGVVGVIAAFVVVSLSFSAQAGEKKKITGTNKIGPPIFHTVVPLGPGDDPKHELVVLEIHRDTTTSSDPDFNEAEHTVYEQRDSVAGTGTHRGYYTIFSKMERQNTGYTKEPLKQRSKKMVLGKRRGRGPGRRLEEPASLRISKAVARIGGRPRQKGPLTSGKVKWNTNVRPSTQEAG